MYSAPGMMWGPPIGIPKVTNLNPVTDRDYSQESTQTDTLQYRDRYMYM